MGNFADGHYLMLIFAYGHYLILFLLIDILHIYIFAVRHYKYYNIHFVVKEVRELKERPKCP